MDKAFDDRRGAVAWVSFFLEVASTSLTASLCPVAGVAHQDSADPLTRHVPARMAVPGCAERRIGRGTSPMRDGSARTDPRTRASGRARVAVRLLIGGAIVAPVWAGQALARGQDCANFLPDQRAFLYSGCPRSSLLVTKPPPSLADSVGKGAADPPQKPQDAAPTGTVESRPSPEPAPAPQGNAPTRTPASAGEGSGLSVLADWLDGPPETGAIRRSWQASRDLNSPIKADIPQGLCLVLIAGTFVAWKPPCAPDTKCEPPSQTGEPPLPTPKHCPDQRQKAKSKTEADTDCEDETPLDRFQDHLVDRFPRLTDWLVEQSDGLRDSLIHRFHSFQGWLIDWYHGFEDWLFNQFPWLKGWLSSVSSPTDQPTGQPDATQDGQETPGCKDGPILAWPHEWLQYFQLSAQPDLYAEVELEPSSDGTALRLHPRLLEFGPHDRTPSQVPLHLSFYAAVSVDGIDLGVTAFRLPSRRSQLAALLPGDLVGHDGLWLPLPSAFRIPVPPATPPREDLHAGLLSVLAVLHQSARDPDTDAHLARILATAQNARSRSVIRMPVPDQSNAADGSK